MKSPDELREQQEGLWRNCTDSITHALEHLSAASQESEPWHDRKWAILSAAHAAEVYCNLLLCQFDPDHPKGRYPALGEARKLLLKNRARLIGSEPFVIEEVLSPLAKQRNILMHTPAPEMLNATDTAIALLALLHIIRRRLGVKTSEFFNQDEVEKDIVAEIEWRKLNRWYRVAEQLVREEYGEGYVEGCDNCGSIAIPPDSSECQACFEPASRSSE